MNDQARFWATMFFFGVPTGYVILNVLLSLQCISDSILEMYSGVAVIGCVLYQSIYYKEIYRARVGAKYITNWWNLRVVKNPDFDPRYADAS